MVSYEQIAEACRYNDAESEEGNYERVMAFHGVDDNALYRASWQRALRAMGILRHGDPFAYSDPQDIQAFSPAEQTLFMMLGATFIDGFMASERVRHIEGRE